MTQAARIAVRREVLVRAQPKTVFSFFTDPAKFAAWFGSGSSLDAVPDGALLVRFPGGTATAEGTVREVEPDRRIVFDWGYPGEDSPLPVGSSSVEITLEPTADGTLIRLVHSVPSDEMAQAHVAGWRHHLSHLATLAARGERADATGLVDRWLSAWNDPDETRRAATLTAICHPDVLLTDDLVTVGGADEVASHMANAQQHLPGISLERSGPARVVAEQVFFDWRMVGSAVGTVATGTTVLSTDLDGRIRRATGCWHTEPDEVSWRLASGEAAAADPDAAAPAIEPHLWASDLEASVSWYQRVLGFEVDARYPEDSTATWYRLVRAGSALMVASVPKETGGTQAYVAAVPSRMSHGGPLALYLLDEHVDAAHARAVAGGGKVIEPLWDPWWGGRQFTLEGPDGVWWTVTTGS